MYLSSKRDTAFERLRIENLALFQVHMSPDSALWKNAERKIIRFLCRAKSYKCKSNVKNSYSEESLIKSACKILISPCRPITPIYFAPALSAQLLRCERSPSAGSAAPPLRAQTFRRLRRPSAASAAFPHRA